MEKDEETKRKQEVDFGRLHDLSVIYKRQEPPINQEEWEKAFDEELNKPANTIYQVLSYINGWLCYAPSSRRPVLLERIISEIKDPKLLYECLEKQDIEQKYIWNAEEREKLDIAWEAASELFFLNDDPVTLANNLFYLRSLWRWAASGKASLFIIVENDNKKIEEYFLKIRLPGDLSDRACLRFLRTATNKKEAERIVAKLSLTNKQSAARPDFSSLTRTEASIEKADKLWRRLSLERFLETKTLAEAEKIQNDFAPDDLLKDEGACRHLTSLKTTE